MLKVIYKFFKVFLSFVKTNNIKKNAYIEKK